MRLSTQENFHVFYVAAICTTTGGTEEIRVCVSRYDQKVFTRGALRLCRET